MSKKMFGDWLTEKLEERNMKPADLSRASGMDSAVVSNIINNKRQQPAVESCKLIAKALNIPLEEVYRAANILPPAPTIDSLTETVIHLMLEMPRSDKEDVLAYTRLRHQLATERSLNNNQKNNKRGARGMETAS